MLRMRSAGECALHAGMLSTRKERRWIIDTGQGVLEGFGASGAGGGDGLRMSTEETAFLNGVERKGETI